MALPQPELLQPGVTFAGHYQVIRCIKTGGMGAIYEAVHTETGRKLALKIMLPSMASDPDLRARFQLEARVNANVESDHLVEVIDAGVDSETELPFLVMELLSGEDVGSILERCGPLSPSDVVLLLSQLALVLDKTHRAGILHRDLKPENLFVTFRDDGSPRLKVLDFGIAKLVAQTTAAKTTRNIGTPLYMSPEQMRGDGGIGPGADLYSLGHVAYTLLVGVPYWQPEASRCDNHHALLLRVLEGAAEAPRGRAALRDVCLPVEFDGWFEQATAMDPADRFASASEMVEALGRALGVAVPRPDVPSFRTRSSHPSFPGHPAAPTLESVQLPSRRPDSSAPRLARPRASRFRPLAVAGVAALLLLGVASGWLGSLRPNATRDADHAPTAAVLSVTEVLATSTEPARASQAGPLVESHRESVPLLPSPVHRTGESSDRPGATPPVVSAPRLSRSALAQTSPAASVRAASRATSSSPLDPTDIR